MRLAAKLALSAVVLCASACADRAGDLGGDQGAEETGAGACASAVDLQLRLVDNEGAEELLYLEGCQERAGFYADGDVVWAKAEADIPYFVIIALGPHAQPGTTALGTHADPYYGQPTPWCYVQGPVWPDQDGYVGFGLAAELQTGEVELDVADVSPGGEVEGTVDCIVEWSNVATNGGGVFVHVTGTFKFEIEP